MDYISVIITSGIVGGAVGLIGNYFYSKTLNKIRRDVESLNRDLTNHMDSAFRFYGTKQDDLILGEKINSVARYGKDSFECVTNLGQQINQLNQRCNAMQNTLNLLNPLTSYIRAKDSVEKTENSHKLNVVRAKELKKAASSLLG